MEPSCCDPHARAGLTHLAHPHRARVRPAEPLDAPGACPALTPRAVASIGVQTRPAGSRAGMGAGLGRGRTRPPEPPPAAPIPVRPAPRDEGITPPSPACPSPALPLLPSQQPCCDMPCHAVPCRANSPFPAPTPFRASSPPSPSIPSSPALPQAPAAGCDPEGLGRGSPWGWDTAGPRGTGQHCQAPGTDLQGEGSGQVVAWPKGGSEEPVWWPSPSGSFQGRFRECWGGCGRSPQLCSHRGAVGSNNFITGTALAAGTGLGKGTGPSVPPEPPLSAASAPAHPEQLEIWLFSPILPLL